MVDTGFLYNDQKPSFTLIRRRHFVPAEGDRSCTLDIFRVTSNQQSGTAARVRYFEDAPEGKIPDLWRRPVMLRLPQEDNIYIEKFIERFCEQKRQAGYTECEQKQSNKEQRCRVGEGDPLTEGDDASFLRFAQSSGLLVPTSDLKAAPGLVTEETLTDNQDAPASNDPPRSYVKKDIPIQTVAKYFHLPIHLAAEKLGVGETWLKQKCREYEIKRWPYRKVKSLDKAIEKVTKALQSCKDPTQEDEMRKSLEELQQHREALCFRSDSTSEDIREVLSKRLMNE